MKFQKKSVRSAAHSGACISVLWWLLQGASSSDSLASHLSRRADAAMALADREGLLVSTLSPSIRAGGSIINIYRSNWSETFWVCTVRVLTPHLLLGLSASNCGAAVCVPSGALVIYHHNSLTAHLHCCVDLSATPVQSCQTVYWWLSCHMCSPWWAVK